jgi:hypothetical protein
MCTAVASQVESHLVHYVWVASTAMAVVYFLCLTQAAGAQPAGALACAARTQRVQSIAPWQAASIVHSTWCWGCLDALGCEHLAAAGPASGRSPCCWRGGRSLRACPVKGIWMCRLCFMQLRGVGAYKGQLGAALCKPLRICCGCTGCHWLCTLADVVTISTSCCSCGCLLCWGACAAGAAAPAAGPFAGPLQDALCLCGGSRLSWT